MSGQVSGMSTSLATASERTYTRPFAPITEHRTQGKTGMSGHRGTRTVTRQV
jgi:hypothetical protein